MGDFTGIFFGNLLAGKNFSHYILAQIGTKIAILFGKSGILRG